MATRCCWYEEVARLGDARAGLLHTPHGTVPTPLFMPVGTRGTVRGMEPSDLSGAGAGMVLANTFHLWERPGHERIERLGGLHGFMGWEGPILTDSGGYQVFSLAHLVKIDERGARFRSPLDGQRRELTPEQCVAIQEALGVDVAMALDECIPANADARVVRESTARTTRWLQRCLDARRRPERTALFGIVQGGTFADQRAEHARALSDLDLDGYAIGGLSVGEGHDTMLRMVDVAAPLLPADRPRYLMGVGHPVDIAEAVIRGVDMFDCVLPTRAGRHGTAYTARGVVNLQNARYGEDLGLLDPETPDSPANRYSLAYLSYLHRARERLAERVVTLHNLVFYQRLMADLRGAIVAQDRVAFDAVVQRARRASVSVAAQGA